MVRVAVLTLLTSLRRQISSFSYKGVSTASDQRFTQLCGASASSPGSQGEGSSESEDTPKDKCQWHSVQHWPSELAVIRSWGLHLHQGFNKGLILCTSSFLTCYTFKNTGPRVISSSPSVHREERDSQTSHLSLAAWLHLFWEFLMIAEVTLEEGVSRTSALIMFKNKLPTPPKQSGSNWNGIPSCKSCVADGYVRWKTTGASEQGLIHERADSSQTGPATENSKRLEGAENKFAGLQISCAGYVGMLKCCSRKIKCYNTRQTK